MKVIFLGTGPAINIPRNGCGCLTCRDARKPGSKSKRTNSSVLIQNKGTNILIDVTPNFKNQITTELRKIRNYENFKIDAVFLTHAHKDAAGGIEQLSRWLKKCKLQTTLYLHKATAQKLKIKNKKSKTQIKNIKIVIIKPFREINIGGLKIQSFPVFHGLKKYPTFGYLIKSPSFPLYQRGIKGDLAHLNKGGLRGIHSSIVYASDMDGAPKKSLKYFRKSKTLILDASMWFGKKIKGHFNVEQAINFTTKLCREQHPAKAVAKKTKLRKLYLTHLGHTFPPHQEAQQQINRYLTKQKIPLKIRIAFDKMMP